MARVIYDGEQIVLDADRLDKEQVAKVVEKYNGTYLPSINGYSFNRSIDLAIDLLTIDNVVIDQSFEPIAKAAKKVQQKRAEDVELLNLPECMYPFQKKSVSKMLKMERNILLASDMGTGKSLMSIMYLWKKENSFPAVVVCPASLKLNWQMEFEKWCPDIKTYVINGRESYMCPDIVEEAKSADVTIINYDILGKENKELAEKEKERIKIAKENGWKYRKAFIPTSGWVDVFNDVIKPKVCIADECQYIESSKAIRSRAVIQLTKDEKIKKLFLSGTPFETRVAQFYNTCHILAPDMFSDEYKFLYRYCNPRYNGFGWEFKGASNIDELRYKLSFFMIRHRKEDVLKDLPKKQKIPIYFDMEKKFRKHYDDMEMTLLAKKDGISVLSYLAEMKKALVEIKKDLVVEYIKDMMDIEDKLVIFTYHTEMFDYLMNKFKGVCVGINGSVAALKRQEAVTKFQTNDKIKLFIGQIQAASVGLTLTASHTVIFTEFGNTVAQMAQAEDRICRIGQEADRCLIYYLIVKDTIDEGPLGTLNNHAGDINAVMNGTDEQMVDLNESMIAKVKERRLLAGRKAMKIDYGE